MNENEPQVEENIPEQPPVDAQRPEQPAPGEVFSIVREYINRNAETNRAGTVYRPQDMPRRAGQFTERLAAMRREYAEDMWGRRILPELAMPPELPDRRELNPILHDNFIEQHIPLRRAEIDLNAFMYRDEPLPAMDRVRENDVHALRHEGINQVLHDYMHLDMMDMGRGFADEPPRVELARDAMAGIRAHYAGVAWTQPTNPILKKPEEHLDDPKWLVEHAAYVPKEWNKKRLGSIIKTRLEAKIDTNLADATRWLAEFETPEELNGERLYSDEDETTLVLALLYGQSPEKLPTKPTRIHKLIRTEEMANLYIALTEQVQSSDGGDISEVINRLVPADRPRLLQIIEDCKKYGLTVTPAQQAETLERLNQMSERRETFVNDAQRWLQTHATTPNVLLVRAWRNRDSALPGGAEDNPSSIQAWIDKNAIIVEYNTQKQEGNAPKNITPEDFKSYAKYVQELARCYSHGTVIRAISRHKEIFNPNALLPAYVHTFEDGWRAEVLDKDDPRGFTIGKDSGCCMTFDGGAKSCIESGYSDPQYSFMALYDDNNRLVAQSLLFVNEKEAPNTIVIDNIETSGGRDRNAALARYREFMGEYVANAFPADAVPIDRVHMGVHSIEQYTEPLKTVSPVKTPNPDTYSDSRSQRIIWDKVSAQSGIVWTPMRRSDKTTVDAMEAAVYGTEAQGGHDILEIDSVSDQEKYSYFLSDKDSTEPFGYVVAYKEDMQTLAEGANSKGRVLYIDDLAILPAAQKTGQGTKILIGLAKIAKDLGIPMAMHAKNDSSWQIFKTHEQELMASGLELKMLESDPDYYENGKGAHLVLLTATS